MKRKDVLVFEVETSSVKEGRREKGRSEEGEGNRGRRRSDGEREREKQKKRRKRGDKFISLMCLHLVSSRGETDETVREFEWRRGGPGWVGEVEQLYRRIGGMTGK